MQYAERYEIHRTYGSGKTDVLDCGTTAAEAETLWQSLSDNLPKGSTVRLVRVATLVVASASRA